MSPNKSCRVCGAPITDDAPEGFCPRCLLREALGTAGPQATSLKTSASPLPVPEIGSRIGRYKLLQELGQGGFGIVYMAEQEEPVRRRVALKVIKEGMDTRQVIARFEAERQALAMMDHPNIAKVLDAGSTENGRPYFVMELVPGIKITEYCDRNRLPPKERLKLFQQVCRAVQHAHQKGIIHRDLKPSNILVTLHDGVPVPKIIDFGIAKATGGRLTDKTLFTAFAQMIGTPAYMSPEQAELSGLDVDTRSDVYSLGVLLYELLTGRPPFETEDLLRAGVDEMRRIIRETEPLKPSTRLSTLLPAELDSTAQARRSDAPKLLNLVRGDLDWIVMKALEKDRNRRYETANGLAVDIQRYLLGEAVSAAAPSAFYRFRKFAGRHRGMLATASGFVLLVLAGAVTASVLANREIKARKRADKALAAEARAVAAEAALRAEAQKKAVALTERLSQIKQREVGEVFEKEGLYKGLACLAQALREDPEDYRSATRLVSILSYNDVARFVSERKFEGVVLDVSFASGGLKVLTDRAGVWMWDYDQAIRLSGPIAPKFPVTRGTFSPSASKILLTVRAGAGSEAVEVWAVTNNGVPEIVIPLQQSHTARQIVLSPDETKLAVVSSESNGPRRVTVSAWDLRALRQLAAPLEESQIADGANIVFSRDGNQIAFERNQARHIWNLKDGSVSSEGSSRDGQAGFLESRRSWYGRRGSSSSDGLLIPSLDGDFRYVILSEVGLQRDSFGWVVGGCSSGWQLSADGTQLATVLGKDRVCMWDVRPHKTAPLYLPIPPDSWAGSGGTASVQLSDDGRTLLFVNDQGAVRVWETLAGKRIAGGLSQSGAVREALLLPDGATVAVCATNGTLQLWQAVTGRLAPNQPQMSSPGASEAQLLEPSTLVCSRSGALLGAVCKNRTVGTWAIPSGKLLFATPAQSAVVSLTFSPDGRQLAIATQDGVLRIVGASNGVALGTPLTHGAAIASVVFNGNGSRLAVASADRLVRIWDTHTGRLAVPPLEHQRPVRSLFYHPEKELLASFSGEDALLVWDAEQGTLRSSLLKEASSYITYAAMPAQHSDYLLMANYGIAMRFDIITGTPLAESLSIGSLHPGSRRAAGLSADGRFFAIAGHEELVFWELPTVRGRAPAWLPKLAEAVAGRTVNNQSQSFRIEPSQYLRVREIVNQKGTDDSFQKWGEWFFASAETQTISPSSGVSWSNYVQECLHQNTETSVRAAMQVAPTDATVLTSYLKLTGGGLALEAMKSDPPETILRVTRNIASRALEAGNALLRIMPDSPVGSQIKAMALAKLNRQREAVNCLQLVPSKSRDAQFFNTLGRLLETLDTNSAYAAFTAAIDAARTNESETVFRWLRSTSSGLPYHYLERAKFLQRHNLASSAGDDRCAGLGIPRRAPSTPRNLIDLSAYYSRPLTNMGWLEAGNDVLIELPTGVQTLAGTQFDIRGFVAPSACEVLGLSELTPSPIPVLAKCRTLHFLLGAANAPFDNEEIGRLRIQYADSKTDVIPIRLGTQVRDWFFIQGRPETTASSVAWVGLNERARAIGSFVRLYCLSWTNPKPDTKINSVSFETSGSSTPFLVAITADETAEQGTPGESGSSGSVRGLNQTLETLEQAIRKRPDYLPFELARTELLAALNRCPEALEVASELVLRSEANAATAPDTLSRALFARSIVLRAMGRAVEAHADWLRGKRIPPRESKADTAMINLTPFYNAALGDVFGAYEAYSVPDTSSGLSELATGVQLCGDTAFDVRGAVVLAELVSSMTRPDYPGQIEGIPIGRRLDRLEILHGAYGYPVADGTEIGHFIVHYAGGTSRKIPIRCGIDVRLLEEVIGRPEASTPKPVWIGSNAMARRYGGSVRLYKTSWENPMPKDVLSTLDYVSVVTNSVAPFLIAITCK